MIWTRMRLRQSLHNAFVASLAFFLSMASITLSSLSNATKFVTCRLTNSQALMPQLLLSMPSKKYAWYPSMMRNKRKVGWLAKVRSAKEDRHRFMIGTKLKMWSTRLRSIFRRASTFLTTTTSLPICSVSASYTMNMASAPKITSKTTSPGIVTCSKKFNLKVSAITGSHT